MPEAGAVIALSPLDELHQKFPEVDREDLALLLKNLTPYREPLNITGPWVVFFKYPEGDEYVGVNSFVTENDMTESLNELTEEIGAEVLAVYYRGKYHTCQRIVHWEIVRPKE